MTLRQALQTVDLNKVYKIINDKDQSYVAECDRTPIEVTVKSYSAVINELLGKPKVKAQKMPWVVREAVDFFDKKKYPDVCFLNKSYVAPKKGLKPWGGKRGEKVPKGYYNANLSKHSKYFAAGMTPWSKVIDTPIVNEAGYSLEKIVAEILWEMTFYGWTEKKVENKCNEISGRINEAMKDIKEGKFVEIPPKQKSGYTVVIPDTVSKQIIDIKNKRGTKK